MQAIDTEEQPNELPDDAVALVLGPFLISKATLRFENIDGEPSPRARAGMEALIAAGYGQIDREGRAEIWSLTEAGKNIDKRSLVKGDIFSFMATVGDFPLSARRQPDADPEP